MAVDEAIVRAVTAGLVPPTLRLYDWEPPCVSIGRGQAGDEVDFDACSRDGVHIVRRPTGGRAILHTDELTYSVVAPVSEPRVARDIVTSYRRLSRALLTALRHLGADVASRPRENISSHTLRLESGPEVTNAVCFEVPSHYELTTAGGRKLLGSAQMRTQHSILQHGTLPLAGDIARICRYLTNAPDPERVRARASTLETELCRPVSWNEAAEAMILGFGTALNLELTPSALIPEEQHWLADLRDAKHGSDIWVGRV
jgi:lipoate-protein ligase A